MELVEVLPDGVWLPNRCEPCMAPLEINYKERSGVCVKCGDKYHVDGQNLYVTRKVKGRH